MYPDFEEKRVIIEVGDDNEEDDAQIGPIDLINKDNNIKPSEQDSATKKRVEQKNQVGRETRSKKKLDYKEKGKEKENKDSRNRGN